MRYYTISVLMLFMPVVLQGQSKQMVDKNNKFAIELLNHVYSDSKNSVLSPVSIFVAMAMAYEGASGSTAKEFVKVFGFEKKKTLHHKSFVGLLNHYNTYSDNLRMANALMAQQDYPFRKEFFDLMADYGAMVQYANFRNETERDAARRVVNNWVEKQTDSKIKELIKKNILDELTRLILVNAIYFKADWAIEFNDKKTRQMIFYGPDKQTISHYMHGRDNYMYYEDSLIQILEMAYSGNAFSMLVVLPRNNIKLGDFIKSIDTYKLNELTSAMSKQHVDVLMPLFTSRDEVALKTIFESMGMKHAFAGTANFKKITGRNDLHIAEVVHRTFLKIDEKGTEASAASAVIIREKSAPAVKPIFFNANRPFIYYIRDNKNDLILFIGSVNRPQKD